MQSHLPWWRTIPPACCCPQIGVCSAVRGTYPAKPAFFTLDIMKDKLASAYKQTDEAAMAEAISDIMDICAVTQNKHLLWFRRILTSILKALSPMPLSTSPLAGLKGLTTKSRPCGARVTAIQTMTTSS